MATTAATLAALARARFVPVVRASTADRALAAALALVEGGCRVVEVAMTVPNAPAVMRALAERGLTVGAGTVLERADAEAAVAAGAAFLVSPAFDPEVLAYARAVDRLMMPGALTPTEVFAARRAGAEVIKIFPAESAGGPRYLKLLNDPFPGLRCFPTGGVNLANAEAYLANGALAVGVGSALVNAAAVEAEDAGTLAALARAWVERLAAAGLHGRAPG